MYEHLPVTATKEEVLAALTTSAQMGLFLSIH